MAARHWQWRVFHFFYFSVFSLKKKLKDANGSGVFPTGIRISQQQVSYEWQHF
jgi:hypothetical protein